MANSEKEDKNIKQSQTKHKKDEPATSPEDPTAPPEEPATSPEEGETPSKDDFNTVSNKAVYCDGVTVTTYADGTKRADH